MITEQIYELIKKNMNDQSIEITPEKRLTADLGLSSMDLINMVVAFEDSFGMTIPDSDLRTFISVSDVLEYFEKTEG